MNPTLDAITRLLSHFGEDGDGKVVLNVSEARELVRLARIGEAAEKVGWFESHPADRAGKVEG